jgi:plastocyanin
MRRALLVLFLAGLSTVGALAGAHAARTDTSLLSATVGANDAYKISFVDAGSAAVTHATPGTFTIDVKDDSAIHNLHLVGPGVDKATTIPGTGETSWTVTLQNGYYRFYCDPHVASMHGAFTVGNGRLPLTASVASKGVLRVKDAFQLSPAKLTEGAYTITVHDRSAKDNFRLTGPGVNRATGIASRGTARWTVTLGPGTYTFRSDSHRARRHTLNVSGVPSWGP